MPEPRILAPPCYVVSDHHFGAVPSAAERDFLHFLEQLRGRAGSLVINGDLFDFWFEWRTVIPRTGYRVLAGIASLVDSGADVVWIGGNHDCWGGDFLRKEVGVHYLLGRWDGSIAGWNSRIEHGDGLRRAEDRGYRVLRSVVRNPLAIRAMRLLHPDLGSWIATRSSSASRVHRARDEGAGLREIARQALRAQNAPDLYILGHSHVPVLERVEQGGVYANAGSWSSGGTHLMVSPERVSLLEFDGSAEVHCLNAIDRGA